jgi:hypothetical protein
MKVHNFSWAAFMAGDQNDVVTFWQHQDLGDFIFDLRTGEMRPRTVAEGAGTMEVPDEWLCPCDVHGRPSKTAKSRPHNWSITEKGWLAVRTEAMTKYNEAKVGYSFEEHEKIVLGWAKHRVKVLARRAAKAAAA